MYYGEPLNKHITKIYMLYKPLRYHAIWEYKRFLAACCVLRGGSLSTFEIFDVTRGQKKDLLQL